ncbi:MAG TPA: SIS domain-containing protein [Gaiellales bacterium]|nr:SIS domain-containing protein [Gaiellales bacterium]
MTEIAGQPAAIRRAAAAAADQAGVVAALGHELRVRERVVLTGMGSSYDACYPAATRLAAAGVLATMVDAAELLHFRLDALGPETLLVCVSQSGESAETVSVVRELRGRGERPFIAAVSNGAASTLARLADRNLDTRGGEEHGPSTMTFAATLVVMAALSRSLAGREPAPAADAEAAAEAAERLLADPEDTARSLAGWLGARPVLALLGRGESRAAAEMGALTLKEAARFPAESLQAAQFRHGPLELAGPELAAIVFASEAPTRSLDIRLAGELVAAGAGVLVISPDGAAPDGAAGIATGELAEGISSAVSIVPVQLLSWALARSRGLAPGTYTIASKVTTHE